MATRARWMLWAATAAIVTGGCTAETESGDPTSTPSVRSPSSTRLEEPVATNTGTRAPRKGETGFAGLPECFGRRATIMGGPGDDRIVGTRAQDVIVGMGGDDLIQNVGVGDRVCTGAGDDTVRSTQKTRRVGRFVVRAVWGVDLGAGDDRVRLQEAIEVWGGPGNDRIVVEHRSADLWGGPGWDFMKSVTTKQPSGIPENAPCLNFRRSPRPVHVNLGLGWARGEGRDRVVNIRCVVGSRYGDKLLGTARRDGIAAGAGNDLISVRAGNDTVDSGPGDDRVYLGIGDDYANGLAGSDRLYGGPGSDNLEGWAGGDYLDGGPNNDQIYAALFCAIGGNSYDTAGLMDSAPNELFGGPGDDYLVGDKGNDRLDGGSGYDQGQGGYHDGRVDWITSLERPIDGCLPDRDFMTLFPGS